MKRIKNILLLFCLSGMTDSLYAQELGIKVNDKGKAGYVDANGNEVVPCKYDAAYPFENEFAKVMKGEKFGLIDKMGNEVVSTKWDELDYDEVYHIYRVKSGKKYGLLDNSGNELLKAAYTYISPFNCYGKALLASGGKSTADTKTKKNYLFAAQYGVLNADGSIAIPVKFKGLYDISKDVNSGTVGEGKVAERRIYYFGDTLTSDCKYMAFDTKGPSTVLGKLGMVDSVGNQVVKPLGNILALTKLFLPHGGMVRCYDYLRKTSNYEISYIDLATQRRMKVGTTKNGSTTYQEATDYMDDIAAVANGDTWAFIDHNGNTVKSGYKSIAKGTACGIWRGHMPDGRCDFFDTEGKAMFDGEGYVDAFFPRTQKGTDTEFLAIKKGEKWGLIDRDNHVKLPFEYDKMIDSRYGYVPVMKDNKWGLLSLDNKVIVPIAYADVTTANMKNPSAVYVKQSDQLWHVYNLAQQKAMGKGYASVGYFQDGLAWGRPSDMKITDNYVNRALNNGNEVVANAFAYVIDDKGEELISVPMPVSKMDEIYQVVRKKGNRPLSQNEMKELQLKLSVRLRHYLMDSQIAETDWDY